MTNRRHFLKIGGLSSLLTAMGLSSCETEKSPTSQKPKTQNKPIVISTWQHGLAANASAWEVLGNGGNALDAVEKGVRVTESDPKVSTVGIGGRPDRTGVVSLDACIMNSAGDCGSVAFLQNIENPISVARKVMEETPHVMLVGQGALDFAKEQGFEEKNLLTDEAEADWKNGSNLIIRMCVQK